jgi:2-alkyl-3-oxoalkanoate reductase
MRIVLAGATGAVGCRLLPILVSAGHSVVGLTRAPRNAEIIRMLGGEPVVANGLDAASINRAVTLAKPDVVVHQMTDLRGASDLRAFDRTFAGSNRLRTDGTDNLLEAARAAGAKRFIAQSFCGWPYARTGSPIKCESDDLDPDPPAQSRRTLDAIRHLENAVTGCSNLDGIVLRYGAIYGPRTGLFDGPMVEQVRRRRVPLIGKADGWWSFLHIDDAAKATAIAIENGNAGIYNIVDDNPAPVNEWLPELARILHAKAPFRVPVWLGSILAGQQLVKMMTQARAGSNAKAKRDLGWQPMFPSWRQGFAAAMAGRQDN